MQAPTSIDGIQFLRAVAALMVVGHHARHYFPESASWPTFGSRGVDIFFVISGFIMAHTTRAFRTDADRMLQAGDFLLRRFIRVVPLYWLALLWTVKRQLVDGNAGLDVVKDFFFVPHFHSVYTESVFPALVPGWTINYEMFFYALFALSLLFGRLRFAVLALALTGCVLLGTVPWQSAVAIFCTSSVLLEFLLGVGVYFAVVHSRPALGAPVLVLATVAGFALLAAENSDATRGYLDGPAAALIVGSTVLWAQGLKIDWLRKLGDASYSIYLFHLASFWIVATPLRKTGVDSATPVNVAFVIALHVATAIAAGLLIHRFVERPLLDLLRPWVRPPVRTAAASRR